MDKKNFLRKKKVLIIDPNDKKQNDKTFCFWAKEDDEIYKDHQNIISKTWTKIRINNEEAKSIYPLKYFHINSLDLYNSSREIVIKYKIDCVKDYVLDVSEKESLYVQTNNKGYNTKQIFDSRPPKLKSPIEDKFYISQSFIGFKIKLIEKSFDSEVFSMMDFRVNQAESTQFVYILPYNKNTALVELTRFGKAILDMDYAEKVLDKFIIDNFGSYEIMDREFGIIPMNPNAVKPIKSNNWTNIGTRAGNVKPSTGYAFKNMYKQSKLICESNSNKVQKNSRKKRFHFYDQLLLIILSSWPKKGKPIFEQLFKTKSPFFVLTFLDEKSNLIQELQMFFKLQIGLFLKATLYWINWKLKPYFVPFLMILAVFFPSGNQSNTELDIAYYQVVLMIFGLLIIGIPHGALDHFTEAINKGKKITFKFVSRYLILMVPIFFIWIWQPFIALLLFLIYSAWHFGQTDVNQWGIQSRIIGFLWGSVILSSLFITHVKDFNLILRALEVPTVNSFQGIEFLSAFIITLGVLFSLYFRKVEWFLVVCFLFLSQFTNLIFSFGIYFLFHHSRLGWIHLKNKLQVSHTKMYLKALPFNLGAIVLFVLFFTNFQLSLKENIAYFFIFLSCVSFPHILCMHAFYKKSNETIRVL